MIVSKCHLGLRVDTAGCQIETNPQVVLVRRELAVDNPAGGVRYGRQREVIMRIWIVDFMQKQGHRLSWLPAGTGHGDEFSRRIIIPVCLYCREAVELRAGESIATRDEEQAIQGEGTAAGVNARSGHGACWVEATIPGPEQFCCGQSCSARSSANNQDMVVMRKENG